ncbi:reverse transcriptase domain-containing protein [Tanacetum coccineum]
MPANHGREGSPRKTSGPTNTPDVRRKPASKLADAVLRVRIMRQKEEAQEEKTKPSHCVKRDTPLANCKRIIQAKARKGQTNPPKKPSEHYGVHQARPWGYKCFHAIGRKKKRHTLAAGTKERTTTWAYGSNNEDDLSQPWLCKKTDPFTVRIRNFEVPKRTSISVNVKTYDGTGDLDDHLKIFQAAEKIERWAMPTWCHMFNSTLIGSARVWFDKLPQESIDNYEMLRKTFLGNYSQQKKYIKDPVEIDHIKQREGESTKAFMERFKAESMHVSGAPECMKISGFMHGITNPDLIKKLNDNIPKSIDEMMSVKIAFLRGELVAANQSKKKAPPAWKHHESVTD